MKKRAAVLAAAAALVLTLSACGNQGGTNAGGGANDPGTGTTGTQDNSGGTNSGVNNGTNSGVNNGGGVTGGTSRSRGSLGSDLRRAADDLVDDVTGQRPAGMTSFEKMLDTARVHDVDGVLTDGENARW